MKNRTLQKKFAFFAVFIAFILSLSGCVPTSATVTTENTVVAPGRDSAPPHFYLGGNLYSYSGRYVRELPEGFEFVKEVKNDSLSLDDPAVDFAGNFEGRIYMSESDKMVAFAKLSNGEVYFRLELKNIYFYFGGEKYILYHKYVHILPEGFTLAGEAETEGEPWADFTGNAEGYIYINENDKSVAYFKLKNWNESVDGKTPYLKFEPEK